MTAGSSWLTSTDFLVYEALFDGNQPELLMNIERTSGTVTSPMACSNRSCMISTVIASLSFSTATSPTYTIRRVQSDRMSSAFTRARSRGCDESALAWRFIIVSVGWAARIGATCRTPQPFGPSARLLLFAGGRRVRRPDFAWFLNTADPVHSHLGGFPAVFQY